MRHSLSMNLNVLPCRWPAVPNKTVLPAGRTAARCCAGSRSQCAISKSWEFPMIECLKCCLAAAAAILLATVCAQAQPVVQIGLNFIGSSYSTNSQALPPDGNGVIGPTRFMEFVNGAVAIYNRTNLCERFSRKRSDVLGQRQRGHRQRRHGDRSARDL